MADYPEAISSTLSKAASGVKEPHRVAIIQDWGVGLQPLYDQYDATQLAFDEATESGLLDRPVEQKVVEIEDGSLYPALYRMEKKGWVDAEWGLSELGRRAKFYRLTPKGRRHLTAQTAEWARFATAISRVLLTT